MKKRSFSLSVDSNSRCPVCCEKFTLAIRKKVTCANCEYVACLSCNQRYLTDATTAVPHCMGCKKTWDSEYMDSVFPKAWMKREYRKHREKVLVDGEIARLPESQALVENYKIAAALQDQLHAEKEERKMLLERIGHLDRSKWNISARIQRIRDSRYQSDGRRYNALGQPESSSSSRQFIRPCPANDCRGFLSTAMKCGVCDLFACAKCFGVVGSNRDSAHTCDPNNVESATLIKKECRGCPSCGTMIYKIDGCDQMWCVLCRNAFSWRTGQPVRIGETIHNPHYYAYLRSQSATGEIPRNPGDEPGGNCGGGEVRYPTIYQVENAIPVSERRTKERDILMSVHRAARHVELWECRRLAREGAAPDNYDLRLQYLLGDLDMENWKRMLLLREKRRVKEIALRHVYELYIGVTGDAFRALVDRVKDVRQTVDDLRTISAFSQDCLDKVSKRFNCVTYALPMNF